jgi:prepilin-type N-terminal cleavage/methylation domain-containing protein
MRAPRSPVRGFTLIELMITLTVLFIFFVMAVPSFAGLKQRSAIRGASDQVLSFWNEARFEAVKRNQLVKVGIRTGADGAFCLGAATTTDEADATPCDCLSAAPAVDACDVARYPSLQSEWRRVQLVGVTIGGTTSLAALHPVVIEPKRTALTENTDKGTISLLGPPGQMSYRMNLAIDQLGRGLLCESSSSTGRLPDYANRRCPD